MHHLTKYLTALAMFAALFLFPATNLLAGDLDSSAAPTDAGSAMFTLEDIFNRLDSGAAVTKRGGAFMEPGAGPTSGTGKTLDEVMAVAPAVNDAAGATAAEVTQGKQFWGLRSGEWGIQTGTLDPHAIPCSGTRWSNTAEDLAGRWCDNGDGTVTDLFGATISGKVKGKGLVWLKKADWGGAKAWRHASTHDDAHTRAGILKSGDDDLTDGSVQGDWRLPTTEELKALTQGTHRIRDYTRGPFAGVQSGVYWSSTTTTGGPSFGGGVNLFNGDTISHGKTFERSVWPVRARQ